MMTVEQFFNEDGSHSHYSVCEVDEHGEILELSTCLIHDTFEQAKAELIELQRST